MIPDHEWRTICWHAVRHGVDPYFMAAIRVVENGGPGREMGVLSVEAATFEDQVLAAVKTVRNALVRFPGNPLQRTLAARTAEDAYRVVSYSRAFVQWFGAQWAPRAAANDPQDLNANWVPNMLAQYVRLVEARYPLMVGPMA